MEFLPDHIVEATKHRDLAALKSWLWKANDPNMRDRERSTLLGHAFSGEGQITWTAGVLELLKFGSYPSLWPHMTGAFWRPLHYAACSGQVAIAEVLLDLGADIGEMSGEHWMADGFMGQMPPLHLAAMHSRLNMTRFLLSRGAALHATNSDGQTAEQKAAPSRFFPVPSDAYILLRDVRLAGSWKRYINEPRKGLLVLRELCSRSRATPPPSVLAALFGAGSDSARPGARRTTRATPLPTPIFWHVLSYWRSDRDFDLSAA